MTGVTKEQVDAVMELSTYTEMKMGNKTTVVCMVMPNGFEMVESSSCVRKEDYDQQIGFECCKDRLRDRVWMLLGYKAQCDQYASVRQNAL